MPNQANLSQQKSAPRRHRYHLHSVLLQYYQAYLLNTEIAIPPKFWNSKKLAISNNLPREFRDHSVLNEELKHMMLDLLTTSVCSYSISSAMMCALPPCTAGSWARMAATKMVEALNKLSTSEGLREPGGSSSPNSPGTHPKHNNMNARKASG